MISRNESKSNTKKTQKRKIYEKYKIISRLESSTLAVLLECAVEKTYPIKILFD